MASNVDHVHAATHALPLPNPGPLPAIGVQLKGPNFLVWKARIEPFLQANGLLGVVDGSFPCPDEFITTTDAQGNITRDSNPAYQDWKIRDQTARGWIFCTCDDTIVTTARQCPSSAAIWQALSAEFMARFQLLQNKLTVRTDTSACGGMLEKGNEVTEMKPMKLTKRKDLRQMQLKHMQLEVTKPTEMELKQKMKSSSTSEGEDEVYGVTMKRRRNY